MGEKVEAVTDFIFLGSKITLNSDHSHEIKRFLYLGRKAMTNLDRILESRYIMLPTEVHIVRAMVFPVVLYRHKSWAIKKAVKWKSLSRVWLLAIQSMEFSRPEYWSGQPFPSPRDHPNPGIEPRSPVLQMDSLSTEPQGKPQNTGVGSLCLLQRIFPTQESNQGLLHCRRILYQLSYQGTNHIIQQLHSQTYISEKWKLMSIQRKLSCFFFISQSSWGNGREAWLVNENFSLK